MSTLTKGTDWTAEVNQTEGRQTYTFNTKDTYVDKDITLTVNAPVAIGDANTYQVLEGATFSNSEYVGLTGLMPDYGGYEGQRIQQTSQLVGGGNAANGYTAKYQIPNAGYYNTNSYLYALTSEFGNATTDKVLLNSTFTATPGLRAKGTMPNNSDWVASTTVKGKIYIPQGYHSGTGYVDTSLINDEGPDDSVGVYIGAGSVGDGTALKYTNVVTSEAYRTIVITVAATNNYWLTLGINNTLGFTISPTAIRIASYATNFVNDFNTKMSAAGYPDCYIQQVSSYFMIFNAPANLSFRIGSYASGNNCSFWGIKKASANPVYTMTSDQVNRYSFGAVARAQYKCFTNFTTSTMTCYASGSMYVYYDSANVQIFTAKEVHGAPDLNTKTVVLNKSTNPPYGVNEWTESFNTTFTLPAGYSIYVSQDGDEWNNDGNVTHQQRTRGTITTNGME